MFPEQVLIQLYDENCVPVRGDLYSAGFDLRVCEVQKLRPSLTILDASKESCIISSGETVAIDCGFRLALPRDLFAYIVPRSSWRAKGLLCQAVFDPGYLEPVRPFVTNCSSQDVVIRRYDRVLQCLFTRLLSTPLIPVKSQITSDSTFYNRGGGTGSTGR